MPTPGNPEAGAGDGEEEEAGAAFPEPRSTDAEDDESEALPDTRVVEGEGLQDGHEPGCKSFQPEEHQLRARTKIDQVPRSRTSNQDLARAIIEYASNVATESGEYKCYHGWWEPAVSSMLLARVYVRP